MTRASSDEAGLCDWENGDDGWRSQPPSQPFSCGTRSSPRTTANAKAVGQHIHSERTTGRCENSPQNGNKARKSKVEYGERRLSQVSTNDQLVNSSQCRLSPSKNLTGSSGKQNQSGSFRLPSSAEVRDLLPISFRPVGRAGMRRRRRRRRRGRGRLLRHDGHLPAIPTSGGLPGVEAGHIVCHIGPRKAFPKRVD